MSDLPAILAGKVVYPLQESAFRRPTFRYLAELEQTQWLSRAEMEQLQVEKLRALLDDLREQPTSRVLEVEAVEGGLQVCEQYTVEVEGQAKPACVARAIMRLYF